MKMADGIVSTTVGLGAGVWTGILQNAVDVLILAIITAIIVPLFRIIVSFIAKKLHSKGLISGKHLELFQTEEEKFFVNFLMKELEKAKKERNDELIEALEKELDKLFKRKKGEK